MAKKAGVKLTPEKIDHIKDLRSAGLPVSEISEQVCVKPWIIRREIGSGRVVLSRARWALRRREGHTKPRMATMFRGKGKTFREIGEILGVSGEWARQLTLIRKREMEDWRKLSMTYRSKL